MERDLAIWKELTIDFRGRTVTGSYSTSREGLQQDHDSRRIERQGNCQNFFA
jgi:hypothetical protein